MVGTSSLSCDHVKHPIPAQPKQMALIHNCLAAGQVGLEPINLIELIRYVGRLPLGGEDVKDVQDVQDVQGGSPRGWATLVVFATCLPACCHLLTFHYIYFTGHNCKVDEWICRLMSPRGWVPAISTTINHPPPPPTGEFICLCEYLFALKPICFIIEFEIEDDIRFPIVWRVVL